MKVVYSFFLLVLFCSINANSQELDLQKAAKEIINSAGSCALITIDKEGRPRARAMDPFTPEDDFSIWFGTNSESRKVSQIKNNPNVTLYYLDSDASGYVMMYGKAEIINSKEAKLKWWKDEWEAFYPHKENNYTLIKVTPEWMEISSEPRGIFGDSITWQPATMKF